MNCRQYFADSTPRVPEDWPTSCDDRFSPPVDSDVRVGRDQLTAGFAATATAVGSFPGYLVSAMNNSGNLSGKRSTRSITAYRPPKISLTYSSALRSRLMQ